MSTSHPPPADDLVDADTVAGQRVLRSEALRQALLGDAGAELCREARALLPLLRGQRAHAALMALAEALARRDAADPTTRRLYAQALIDTGATIPALAVVQALADRLPDDHPESAEAWGLVGRCHKQVFVDAVQAAGGRVPAHAARALQQAQDAYARPYRVDPQRHHWHGVNLLALASRARREGLAPTGPGADPAALARRLVADLQAPCTAGAADVWQRASLAEAALGQALLTGHTDGVEACLAAYLFAPGIQAFEVASTLRQFTEVWGLDSAVPAANGGAPADAATLAWARHLLDRVRTRLLQLPGGALAFSPAALAAALRRPHTEAARPDAGTARGGAAGDGGQLEALLGQTRARPMSWWAGGLEAARAVALVRKRMGARLGSGFLLRAGDLGLTHRPDDLLLLTNFHVVNRQGEPPGIRPDQAEVLFEAVDPTRTYTVAELLWESPVAEHDAALLRLSAVPAGVPPLRPAARLPPRPVADTPDEDKPRVFIIGHPGGREVSISMADNALIDHEAPPDGQPQHPGVWRLHYRAPTEGGSSGSPVFDDEDWGVIALHHKGGRFGMPRLNGQGGHYAANEGLALPALAAAARAALNPA